MIEILRNPEQTAWDAYAAKNGAAAFSHRYAWGQNLADAYRLPIFRLAARNGPGAREFTGTLALMLFAAPGRDLRLVSLPYTDAAGIVADDPATGAALLAAAFDLAVEQDAVHLELRQAGVLPFHAPDSVGNGNWQHTPHTFKTGLHRPLPGTCAELWALLPAKVRNQVRKARACGCTAAIGGLEYLEAFYAVFSENMRDLGSPVHPPDLFRMALSSPSLDARLAVVFLSAEPVAAAMVFQDHATLSNPWASSLRRCRPSCPNMLLYWAMLELAETSGCRQFDFGRSSPDSPACRFKRQWGASLQPLVWHVFSRPPHRWDPRCESLVDESWKTLGLSASRLTGPVRRRWISL